MDNYFYNTMFNPQYVNPDYYKSQRQMQYTYEQDKKVADAVKAIHDLCEAIKGMDQFHQQQAVQACLAQMVLEFGWNKN